MELTNDDGETKITFYKRDGKLIVRAEEDFNAGMPVATNEYIADFEEFTLNINRLKETK